MPKMSGMIWMKKAILKMMKLKLASIFVFHFRWGWLYLEKIKLNMQINLKGKTALVGGALAGFGKAIAVELAKCGARVFLMARNEDKLKRHYKIYQGMRTGTWIRLE